MPTASALARDLKALGASAPLRAAYEVSKRSGLHAVLFRARRNAPQLRSRPLGFGAQLPQSEPARARCLEDASKILQKGTRVFGLGHVPTGVHAAWNVDPLTGDAWPQLENWWDIDIRSDGRLSDVKFVWEAGRHRDLVVLARAAAIDPHGEWLEALERSLQSWVKQCPPERGVHWYSSLELALRAVAWSQILGLVGDRFEPELRAGLDAQLLASARHIMVELPYTVSSMKNNHLLGDGLGLIVIGRLFPAHKHSSRWQRIGNRLFMKQLGRHMRADGSMIEDSLSYHRFVLEMLIIRVLLGDADSTVASAMEAAASHLHSLGVFEGQVPQFGDWDEGRVLADSAPAGSVAGSAWLGLALSGVIPPSSAHDEHDELAWYAQGTPEPEPVELAPLGRVTTGGGFTRVHHGPWHVWFKTGGGPSHQHADVSAVYIRHDDSWLVCDPGTGTYNGPLHVRNGFRTSTAHPVWHPVGADQMEPHRAFRWLRTVRGYAAAPLVTETGVTLFGWHDAFENDPFETRVARAVSITEQGVTVADFIEKAGHHPWQLTVPLPPDQDLGPFFGLEGATTLAGQDRPFAGWNSRTYGEWIPSRWSTLQAPAHDLPVWGVGQPTGGLELRVVWEPDRVTLEIEGSAETLRMGAPRG